MIVTKEDINEHNIATRSQILDHPSRKLIIGVSGSGTTNSFLNLISPQPDIDNIYLYTKGSYETKYQLLIRKREDEGIKIF